MSRTFKTVSMLLQKPVKRGKETYWNWLLMLHKNGQALEKYPSLWKKFLEGIRQK